MKWYRELHPIKEGKRLYRFGTTCIGSLPLYGRARSHRNCLLKDSKGIVRAWIHNGRLWWTEDYWWNGCSPKRYILGVWVGTPDFEKTRRPSLGHDIIFQFAKLLDITFHEASVLFRLCMEDEGFKLAEHYFNAVETFGHSYWKKEPDTLTIEYV